MTTNFDKDKIVECMFDPVTSSIIAELEGGQKLGSELAQACSISEGEVKDRLSYLVEHEFIIEKNEGSKTIFEADEEKLALLVEQSDSFDGAIDGLTKMDGYLN